MDKWHKLVIEGTRPSLHAFVKGFAAGRETNEPVLFGDEVDLERHSLAEKLRELFDSPSHHLVFAHPATADALLAAMAEHERGVGLRCHSRFEVTGGRFDVAVEAFTPDVAARIRDELFQSLAEGVSLAAFDDAEEHHPEARGPELYAPAHSYTYRATATLVGPFLGVLEMHRRAKNLDFVTIGRLHIDAIELERG